MIPEGTVIPVELEGGPMDGVRAEVTTLAPPFDMYLFDHAEAGRVLKLGYRFACRSTFGGRYWVLEFDSVVSAWPMEPKVQELSVDQWAQLKMYDLPTNDPHEAALMVLRRCRAVLVTVLGETTDITARSVINRRIAEVNVVVRAGEGKEAA